MSPAFSRREMLRTLAGSGLVLGVTRTRADDRPIRKFTKDLVCGNSGNIRVSARLPEAIAMAHRHGFESVVPDIGYLKSISDSQLSELRDDLKAKNLVWGGAGLSVNFRGGQAAFQDGLRGLADDAKALQRAGASRMGTWLTPGHNSLTYLANFKQHTARLGEIGKVACGRWLRLAVGLEVPMPHMIRTMIAIALALGLTSSAAGTKAAEDARDIRSDTWTATDALGRPLPGSAEASGAHARVFRGSASATWATAKVCTAWPKAARATGAGAIPRPRPLSRKPTAWAKLGRNSTARAESS